MCPATSPTSRTDHAHRTLSHIGILHAERQGPGLREEGPTQTAEQRGWSPGGLADRGASEQAAANRKQRASGRGGRPGSTQGNEGLQPPSPKNEYDPGQLPPPRDPGDSGRAAENLVKISHLPEVSSLGDRSETCPRAGLPAALLTTEQGLDSRGSRRPQKARRVSWETQRVDATHGRARGLARRNELTVHCYDAHDLDCRLHERTS